MGNSLDLLVFEVAGQRYALPVRDVLEVVRAVAVTPLPKAPPIVEGLINVRGGLLPVLDLRQRFGLPAKKLTPSDHLVLADARGRAVAVRVDRVLDLMTVGEAEVSDPRETGMGMNYVAGVAKLPDGLVLIHDLREFLSQAEGMALDVALTAY